MNLNTKMKLERTANLKPWIVFILSINVSGLCICPSSALNVQYYYSYYDHYESFQHCHKMHLFYFL